MISVMLKHILYRVRKIFLIELAILFFHNILLYNNEKAYLLSGIGIFVVICLNEGLLWIIWRLYNENPWILCLFATPYIISLFLGCIKTSMALFLYFVYLQ